MANSVKYLLLFLPLAPAWGGSIALFGAATSSCVVTTLPTNAIVANDCSSTPGISASGHGQFSINATWGQDIFVVNYGAGDASMVSNHATDPNLVATESLSGHLEYEQNFIITGGSGVGFISSSLPIQNDQDGFGTTSCSFHIFTGVNPTIPGGPVQFTFGVPFSVQIVLDISTNASAPFNTERLEGESCNNIGTVNITDSQGQSLTNFDIEPDVPEPGTWLLVTLGLLGCWLMKSRAA